MREVGGGLKPRGIRERSKMLSNRSSGLKPGTQCFLGDIPREGVRSGKLLSENLFPLQLPRDGDI